VDGAGRTAARERWQRRGRSALPAVLLAAAAAAAAYLLYSCYCAFTNLRFTATDYGKYLNMIWNCGHGRPFRAFVDHSYLETHLSFSLALLGPFFRVWDHPFLLSALQWMGLAGGAAISGATLRRAGVAPAVTAAFVFFYVANPFTQRIALSEFHGVAMYLLLVPWLVRQLVFARRSVAWPLIPILLLREDAGFVVVPVLLYVAIRERWRAGYAWAAASLVYAVVACTALMPWIGGVGLVARRPHVSIRAVFREAVDQPLSARLVPLLWLLAPALPAARRGWRPLLAVPSVAILMTSLSPLEPQAHLAFHYAAPAMAFLAAGLALALARPAPGRRPAGLPTALAIAAITLVAHLRLGFLPGGPAHTEHYRRLGLDGPRILRAARAIPTGDLVACNDRFIPFVANRPDVIPLRHWADHPLDTQTILTTFSEAAGLAERGSADLPDPVALLRSGAFGVRYVDGRQLVLRRGDPTGGNAEVLARLDRIPRTLVMAAMKREAGGEIWGAGCYVARHWPGDRTARPRVAYGRSIPLPPGRYRAHFRFRAGAPPAGAAADDLGTLALAAGGGEPLARAAIDPAAAGGGYVVQSLDIALSGRARVEPVVTGGAAPLWLDEVYFESRPPDDAP
jgi:hypothetical protein